MDAEDNRAVSALFRVFGSRPAPLAGDRVELTSRRGMHRGEWSFLAVLVPLTVAVACGEWLVRWLGWATGLALVVPATFVALNLIPILMRGGGMTRQWRLWLGMLVLWGLWRMNAGGLVGGAAWLWLGIALLNAVAAGILVWRRAMKWKGDAGLWWRGWVLFASHAGAAGIGWAWGWGWMVLAGALVAGGYCWCVLNPASQVLGRVARRCGEGKVLLTIDDGPDPKDTPMLLDLLDEYGVKAVFFMIGEKVKAHPELAREVARRGHEIGNHTMTHPRASFWCAGPWRTRREIGEAQRLIEETTGVRPRWFRAPVGHRNWFTHPVAAELGMEVMGWSKRGYDAVEKNPEVVLKRMLAGLATGDVVLMHEATPICEAVARGVLERMEG